MSSPIPRSWRKSSRSGNESNCVEVTVITGGGPVTAAPTDQPRQ